MAHNLTQLYETKVVPGLYKQYYQTSTTSWMESNAIGVDYTGGKYVTMRDMDIDGLGNYDRMLGYPRGNVTGTKKQYEMTMDRGREFLFDVADIDETGFLVTAASAMTEFQKRHVIPEIDAFRYSKIYKTVSTEAASNVKSEAIPANDITDVLADDLAKLRDKFGDFPMMIIMSGLTQAYFGKDFTRSLDVINLMKGNIATKVKSLDNDPFTIVRSASLKTEYEFFDGVTAGQEKGGHSPKAGAKDMKWIITPLDGPIAVAKIDKTRVFSPDEYQGAHAWKTDYRMFHDLWMKPDAISATLIRTGDITTA